jgi:LacI family transcriptional regulator
VQLLIDAGYGDGIALVGQSDEAERDVFRSATVARRVSGIRSAMTQNGVKFVAEESIWLWEPEGGYTATTALLSRRDDIRALLCMNDRIAFGAYQALADAGLSVPGDVAVVSFDNDELAAYLRPGLTTVGLPHEQMGRRAVELLLSGEQSGETLIPMPVVERFSIVAGGDS